MSQIPRRVVHYLLVLLFSCSLLAGQSLSDTFNSQSGSGSDATTQPTPHSITLEEYCSFLNVTAMIDTYSLYDEKMGLDEIIRSGEPGSYSYSVIAGKENSPIVNISWNNAARYCNWRENGMPCWEENADATESGIYEFKNDQVISIIETTSNFFVNAENISSSRNENDDPDLRSNEMEFCEGVCYKKAASSKSDDSYLVDGFEIITLVAVAITGERAGLCRRNAGSGEDGGGIRENSLRNPLRPAENDNENDREEGAGVISKNISRGSSLTRTENDNESDGSMLSSPSFSLKLLKTAASYLQKEKSLSQVLSSHTVAKNFSGDYVVRKMPLSLRDTLTEKVRKAYILEKEYNTHVAEWYHREVKQFIEFNKTSILDYLLKTTGDLETIDAEKEIIMQKAHQVFSKKGKTIARALAEVEELQRQLDLEQHSRLTTTHQSQISLELLCNHVDIEQLINNSPAYADVRTAMEAAVTKLEKVQRFPEKIERRVYLEEIKSGIFSAACEGIKQAIASLSSKLISKTIAATNAYTSARLEERPAIFLYSGLVHEATAAAVENYKDFFLKGGPRFKFYGDHFTKIRASFIPDYYREIGLEIARAAARESINKTTKKSFLDFREAEEAENLEPQEQRKLLEFFGGEYIPGLPKSRLADTGDQPSDLNDIIRDNNAWHLCQPEKIALMVETANDECARNWPIMQKNRIKYIIESTHPVYFSLDPRLKELKGYYDRVGLADKEFEEPSWSKDTLKLFSNSPPKFETVDTWSKRAQAAREAMPEEDYMIHGCFVDIMNMHRHAADMDWSVNFSPHQIYNLIIDLIKPAMKTTRNALEKIDALWRVPYYAAGRYFHAVPRACPSGFILINQSH